MSGMINPSPKVNDMIDQRKLREIYESDGGKLYARMSSIAGGQPSGLAVEEVHHLLTAERTMDAPPKRYKPSEEGGIPSGVKVLFASNFDNMTFDSEDPFGEIIVEGTVIRCDVEVIRVMKALLRTGSCFNEEQALACRKVFSGMFKLVSKSESHFISKTMMLEYIKEFVPEDGYYVNALREVIEEIFA